MATLERNVFQQRSGPLLIQVLKFSSISEQSLNHQYKELSSEAIDSNYLQLPYSGTLVHVSGEPTLDRVASR